MISLTALKLPFFLAFGIPSGPDLIILLIIVLVLFGAKRLPEIARSLGQSVHEFKKAKQEFEEAATPSTPTPVVPVAQPTQIAVQPAAVIPPPVASPDSERPPQA